ncbi:MAG: cupredoxin domain-containing protein [Actinomycetota bacterium]|nr:cupredoxin domain-containing protein [Actinomycetota bacterium]
MLATFLFGSGGGAGSSSTDKENTVVIKNFAFSPSPLRVKAGTTISIINSDDTTHTFTADDRAFDTGELKGHAQAMITRLRPGTHAYHCQIHDYMTGVINVGP